MSESDSPWKVALEGFFRPFLLFFFPGIHADIDWSKGYNARLFDRYNRDVCSLAVLVDDNPDWRPSGFRRELWGCSVRMNFRPVKLLDYAGQEEELEADTNLFAKIVLAQLKAIQTRDDPAGRRVSKFRLVRGLFEQGLSPDEVRQLFNLIEMFMELPHDQEAEFQEEIEQYLEDRRMPYVTGIERLGMARMLERFLRDKFGEEGVALMAAITELNDADKYLALNSAIAKATCVDDVRQACAELAKPPAPRRKKKGSPNKGKSS
jgi:hypothetical protein